MHHLTYTNSKKNTITYNILNLLCICYACCMYCMFASGEICSRSNVMT